MIESKSYSRRDDATSIAPKLLEHFDELLVLLQDNNLAGVELLLKEHPEHAEQLRQVLPAMEIMASLKAIDGSGSLLESPSTGFEAIDERSLDEAVLGDFRLVREIGRGGMGIVYEAIQLSLQRRVAVKVLPLAGVIDQRAMARFQNEARAAATLFHPHIVPVLFVGVERGVHFYAMNLIAGQSLAEIIPAVHPQPTKKASEPPKTDEEVRPSEIATRPIAAASTLRSERPRDFARRIAEIGMQIASGLHFAHEHGIVHRDVKPGNILMDEHGKAWITDFGLARLEADPGMTASGDLLGTLRYMSPEQVSGRAAAVDQRTDVYALGATLYELATGQPLFAGHDRHGLTQAILNDEPRAPRSLQPALPRDLETIILKAVEKDRQDRYPTAAAMADDLQRFCQDEAIHARRPSRLALVARWTRRHGAILLAVAVTLLLCATVSALMVTGAWRRERHQRVIAEDHLALARTAVDKMYTNVATTWLANDPALSSMQKDFLRDGLAIYEQLAESGGNRPADQSHVSIAHLRIAEIRSALGEHVAAAESLERSIAILQDLSAEDPDDASLRGQLIETNQTAALTYHEIGDYENARRALERNEPHLQFALATNPLHAARKPRELRQHYALAVVHVGLEEFDVAETHIRQAVAGMKEQARKYKGLAFDVHRFNYQYLLGVILREQNKLEEARETCERVLRSCQHRTGQYDDSRELHELIAAIHEELAEISVAEGKHDEAVTHLEQSLSEQRRYLTDNVGPAIRYMQGWAENRSNGGSERDRYGDYVRVQIRLAEVYQQMGRLYDAERVLSEVFHAAFIMGGPYRSKQSFEPRVLFIHGCALLASILEGRHPVEAALVRDVAVAAWVALKDDLATPHHDAVDALKHLTRTDQTMSVLNSAGPTPDVRDAVDAFQTSLRRTRIGGHVSFATQNWQSAAACFQKVLDTPDQATAYDCLLLAMALQELGNTDESHAAYDRAKTLASPEPAPDVADLQARVAQRLELSAQGD
jgi:serine/threonine protein kinase/tetratricopeptide (TPR) repeat protein